MYEILNVLQEKTLLSAYLLYLNHIMMEIKEIFSIKEVIGAPVPWALCQLRGSKRIYLSAQQWILIISLDIFR